MQQEMRSSISSGLIKKFNIEPENSLKSLLGSVTSSDGDPDAKFSGDTLPLPSGNKEVQSPLPAKSKQARLVTRSPLLIRRPSKSVDNTVEADRAPDRPKSDMGSFARRDYTQNLSASVGADRGRRLSPQTHGSTSLSRFSGQQSSPQSPAPRQACADIRAREAGLRAATWVAIRSSAPTHALGSSAPSSPCSSVVCLPAAVNVTDREGNGVLPRVEVLAFLEGQGSPGTR